MEILKLSGVTKKFGGVSANDNISFSVYKGEILGLIGHNGAGKTTLFNVITGNSKPDNGRIFYKNDDVTGFSPAKIAAKGIARTFQDSNLFKQMTVYQNINVAHVLLNHKAFWNYILNTPGVKAKDKEIHRRTESLIDFFQLNDFRNTTADNLSYGYQRILGICIALSIDPKLLLLDEPVAGMNETETDIMINHIKKIRDMGITIIIIEHDMKALMGVSDRIIALGAGRKIAEGTPAEIQINSEVIESFLGKKEDF